MPVLFVCSQVACILLVIGLSLVCIWDNGGRSVLVLGVNPWGRILADWSVYKYYSKFEVLAYDCNIV